MATPGLSLVGFMHNQQQAVSHLKIPCVPNPPNKSDTALAADWVAAQARLGAPFANAGQPSLQAIPITDPHIQQLLAVSWAPSIHALLAQGATFQMVEIDPLLAFQFTVDTARAANHCGTLSHPPGRQEALNVGLPLILSIDQIHASQQGQSVILKSRSLNLGLAAQGPMSAMPDVIGIQFAWTLPLIHVVRYNGRCYLHNGYHRAYGMRTAGATTMPCMFRDVPDANAAGIKTDGSTFDEALLTSNNPPTFGHFTQGRASPVELRSAIRILQVNWSQHTVFDE